MTSSSPIMRKSIRNPNRLMPLFKLKKKKKTVTFMGNFSTLHTITLQRVKLEYKNAKKLNHQGFCTLFI